MMRSIALCADDYALHPLVDEAVEQLVLQGRLSATSCMTTSPLWKHAAQRLPALRPRLSVGLHFNLTEGHGVQTAPSIGQVIGQMYTRRATKQQLLAQWKQQLDAFEDALGTAPDFIDGHQHVHQLPVVRDALLQTLEKRYGWNRARHLWVRSTAPAGELWKAPKASIIAMLGGWTNTRRLRAQRIPQNHGFGGVYDFDAQTTTDYDQHMRSWLTQSQQGSLMMCHPATAPVVEDAIGHARALEFAYLQSDAFGQALQDADCQIAQGPLLPLFEG